MLLVALREFCYPLGAKHAITAREVGFACPLPKKATHFHQFARAEATNSSNSSDVAVQASTTNSTFPSKGVMVWRNTRRVVPKTH